MSEAQSWNDLCLGFVKDRYKTLCPGWAIVALGLGYTACIPSIRISLRSYSLIGLGDNKKRIY